MSADFHPNLNPYKDPQPFRYWVQKTLPLVYDDALTVYELLAKVIDYINNLISDNQTIIGNIDAVNEAFEKLQEYVNDYFDTLDATAIIEEILNRFAEDGTLMRLLIPIVRNSFTPTVVSSTAAMTDSAKIYILTTDRHVYFYNTTTNQFEDSGIIFGTPDSYFIDRNMLNPAQAILSIPDAGVYSLTPVSATAAPLSYKDAPSGYQKNVKGWLTNYIWRPTTTAYNSNCVFLYQNERFWIGLNGVWIYDSNEAANAELINELKDEIESAFDIQKAKPILLTKADFKLLGYYNGAKGYVPNERWRATDFIEIPSDHVLHIDSTVTRNDQSRNMWTRIYAYDESKTYLGAMIVPQDLPLTAETWSFNLRNVANQKYLTISFSVYELSEGQPVANSNFFDESSAITLRDTNAPTEDVITLHDNVIMPARVEADMREALDGKGIIARRPCVSIILDGDYSRNGEASDIAEQYGIKVAFAPQGRSSGDLNIMSNRFYREKEKAGHEILMHSHIIFQESTGTTAEWDGTPEGAFKLIKRYREHFYELGLHPVGIVGSSGLIEEQFMGAVYRYFEYGSTLNNGTDTAIYSYILGTDKPYRLWRYSLSSTTANITNVLKRVSDNTDYYGAMIFYTHARGSSDSGTPIDMDAFEARCEIIGNYIEQNKVLAVQPRQLVSNFFTPRYDDFMNGLAPFVQ